MCGKCLLLTAKKKSFSSAISNLSRWLTNWTLKSIEFAFMKIYTQWGEFFRIFLPISTPGKWDIKLILAAHLLCHLWHLILHLAKLEWNVRNIWSMVEENINWCCYSHTNVSTQWYSNALLLDLYFPSHSFMNKEKKWKIYCI